MSAEELNSAKYSGLLITDLFKDVIMGQAPLHTDYQVSENVVTTGEILEMPSGFDYQSGDEGQDLAMLAGIIDAAMLWLKYNRVAGLSPISDYLEKYQGIIFFVSSSKWAGEDALARPVYTAIADNNTTLAGVYLTDNDIRPGLIAFDGLIDFANKFPVTTFAEIAGILVFLAEYASAHATRLNIEDSRLRAQTAKALVIEAAIKQGCSFELTTSLQSVYRRFKNLELPDLWVPKEIDFPGLSLEDEKQAFSNN